MRNAMWRLAAVAAGLSLFLLGQLVVRPVRRVRVLSRDRAVNAPAAHDGEEAGLLLVPYWGLPR
jgi:hypothetical protein